MKINTNLCNALLLLLSFFFGQTQEIERLEKSEATAYGIKVGLNFAELWGTDALPESDRKTGYSLGVYASYKLSKSLKLQPELIWSLQGENSKENGRYKISYLNIPIMFKWTEGQFYYELGPQLGLLTVSTSKSIPEDLKLDNFETFDFSLNIGLGYKLTEDWAIGLRYGQGISNIVKDRDLKNSVFYLGMAYRLF